MIVVRVDAWQAGKGSMIELMKFDMGGSGCTLGAAKVLKCLP